MYFEYKKNSIKVWHLCFLTTLNFCACLQFCVALQRILLQKDACCKIIQTSKTLFSFDSEFLCNFKSFYLGVVLKKETSKEPCPRNMRTANLYKPGIIRLSIFGCDYNFVWLYNFSHNSFLENKIAKNLAPGTCELQNSLRVKAHICQFFRGKKLWAKVATI